MNKEVGILITLNKQSLKKAIEIKSKLADDFDLDVYCLKKYIADEESLPIDRPFSQFVADAFKKYRTIIFMCASGIVIREIYPYLKDKMSDPAVLLIEGKGQFIIPLLSGHWGGANQKAIQIGRLIGATPVITTASDLNQSLAVDTLARSKNLEVCDLQKAKEVTAMILSGEKVGILNTAAIDLTDIKLPANVALVKSEEIDSLKGIIEITNKNSIAIHPYNACLVKKNIVIGIGFRKETKAESIIDEVKKLLEEKSIYQYAVKCFATVAAKSKEAALEQAAVNFHAGINTVPYHQVIEVESLFKKSEFVKKTLGVGCVAEPCGYIASNKGMRLSEKNTANGITLCLWKEE